MRAALQHPRALMPMPNLLNVERKGIGTRLFRPRRGPHEPLTAAAARSRCMRNRSRPATRVRGSCACWSAMNVRGLASWGGVRSLRRDSGADSLRVRRSTRCALAAARATGAGSTRQRPRQAGAQAPWAQLLAVAKLIQSIPRVARVRVAAAANQARESSRGYANALCAALPDPSPGRGQVRGAPRQDYIVAASPLAHPTLFTSC